MSDIMREARFTAARVGFELACLYSRRHDALARKALRRYGEHGAQISGCVRDHFPDRVKDELRELAWQVTLHSDAAWRNRPRYVRNATMRRLSRAIAARDGSGFYGPQA